MEDRLQPKTAPQCTREPYTAGVLEAPAGYSGQAARTGRTAFMSGPVFGDRSQPSMSLDAHLHIKILHLVRTPSLRPYTKYVGSQDAPMRLSIAHIWHLRAGGSEGRPPILRRHAPATRPGLLRRQAWAQRGRHRYRSGPLDR